MGFRKRFGRLCLKQLAAALLVMAGACGAFAQYSSMPVMPGYGPGTANLNTATSLSGGFFQGDFFNASAFINGIYDSVEQNLNASSKTGGFGFEVGGGISASKSFSDSMLSLSYRGGYRHYPSGFGTSGPNQNFALIYGKRFGPRWTLLFNEAAGIMLYDTVAYNTNPSVPPLSNPFSPSTRFAQSSVTATYRQTQRLTYTATGTFFVNRYSSGSLGQAGTTGGIYSGSVEYELTPRTRIAGTYTHDDFFYQGHAGTSHVNGASASVTHIFGRGWTARFSAGVSHVDTAGIYRVPVLIDNGSGQLVPGFVLVPYNTTKFIPTFGASLLHRFRILNVSVNALHGVNPGNGTFLTSSNTAVNGYASRAFGRTAILTAAASFSHLTSIAEGVGQSYSQTNITAFYSRVLFSHISGYASYSLIRYSSVTNFSASTDNRFIFGLSFSLRNVPFTLF
jgi:hypothetical protein